MQRSLMSMRLPTQIKTDNESIAKAEQILSEEKLSVVEIFVHSFWDDLIEQKIDTFIKDLAKIGGIVHRAVLGNP